MIELVKMLLFGFIGIIFIMLIQRRCIHHFGFCLSELKSDDSNISYKGEEIRLSGGYKKKALVAICLVPIAFGITGNLLLHAGLGIERAHSSSPITLEWFLNFLDTTFPLPKLTFDTFFSALPNEMKIFYQIVISSSSSILYTACMYLAICSFIILLPRKNSTGMIAFKIWISDKDLTTDQKHRWKIIYSFSLSIVLIFLLYSTMFIYLILVFHHYSH